MLPFVFLDESKLGPFHAFGLCCAAGFFLDRVPVGRPTEGTVAVSRRAWVNPLSLLTNAEGLCARGYPYEERGPDEALTATRTVTPLFNEGLWSGTADINGIDKLAGARATDHERRVTGQMIVAPWRNLPLSIMNVQLHRDLAPAFSGVRAQAVGRDGALLGAVTGIAAHFSPLLLPMVRLSCSPRSTRRPGPGTPQTSRPQREQGSGSTGSA